ncbi:MAG: rod shape-determining protein [Tissierellia bacterium]|nr:rod shape-determining protein [Tissierellia bacterium]
MSKFRLFSTDLAIDLGTANILVYKKNEGLVVNEPSVVALDAQSDQIVAIGQKAKDMLGKTPDKLIALRPLAKGMISDFDLTEAMLNYFFKKVNPGFSLFQPRVVICVPSGVTDVQRRAVEDAALHAGCRDVILIEESLAASFGLDESLKDKSKMILNTGAGTSEVAVISLDGIVTSKSIRKGGDTIDENIISFFRNEKKLEIGKITAEDVKINLCSLKVDRSDEKMVVHGRDILKGRPHSIEITSKELIPSIIPFLDELIETVMIVLENTPPELSADIKRNGIILTGGNSKLDGLKEYLSRNIKLDIITYDNPLTATIDGSGYILSNLDKFLRSK